MDENADDPEAQRAGALHVYFLVGVRNRVSVALEWLWAYFTFRRGTRLITWQERG